MLLPRAHGGASVLRHTATSTEEGGWALSTYFILLICWGDFT